MLIKQNKLLRGNDVVKKVLPYVIGGIIVFIISFIGGCNFGGSGLRGALEDNEELGVLLDQQTTAYNGIREQLNSANATIDDLTERNRDSQKKLGDLGNAEKRDAEDIKKARRILEKYSDFK